MTGPVPGPAQNGTRGKQLALTEVMGDSLLQGLILFFVDFLLLISFPPWWLHVAIATKKEPGRGCMIPGAQVCTLSLQDVIPAYAG